MVSASYEQSQHTTRYGYMQCNASPIVYIYGRTKLIHVLSICYVKNFKMAKFFRALLICIYGFTIDIAQHLQE